MAWYDVEHTTPTPSNEICFVPGMRQKEIGTAMHCVLCRDPSTTHRTSPGRSWGSKSSLHACGAAGSWCGGCMLRRDPSTRRPPLTARPLVLHGAHPLRGVPRGVGEHLPGVGAVLRRLEARTGVAREAVTSGGEGEGRRGDEEASGAGGNISCVQSWVRVCVRVYVGKWKKKVRGPKSLQQGVCPWSKVVHGLTSVCGT